LDKHSSNQVPAGNSKTQRHGATMTTVRHAVAVYERRSPPTLAGEVWLDSSGLGPFETVPAVEPRGEAGLTSPMELLAAAYASCLDLTLALLLDRCGHPCEWLSVTADVSLDMAGHDISGLHSSVRAAVPGMTLDELTLIAERAKDMCPVGRALTGAEITIDVEVR
jgi:lipoyl-dependent peroxiredoxin